MVGTVKTIGNRVRISHLGGDELTGMADAPPRTFAGRGRVSSSPICDWRPVFLRKC